MLQQRQISVFWVLDVKIRHINERRCTALVTKIIVLRYLMEQAVCFTQAV